MESIVTKFTTESISRTKILNELSCLSICVHLQLIYFQIKWLLGISSSKHIFLVVSLGLS